MRLPQTSARRSITMALVATWAVAAIGLWGITAVREVSPTGRVLSAARRRVPGIVVQSMQPWTFNRRQAWEVRGIDREGTEWLLDISASGEILMSEPVAYGPPRTMVEPYGQ